MVGASHGGLTFDLADLDGGGVYTAFFRTRDFGTVISCVYGLAGVIVVGRAVARS
jgi:hypothetical protein